MLAVVRSLGSPRQLGSAEDEADYEQELVDQYLLACVGAGICDSTVIGDRSALFEFIRYLGRPVWTAKPADADRFLASQRRAGRAALTVQKKDRILDEAHATSGDLRMLCELFGLSAAGAMRYIETVNSPDPAAPTGSDLGTRCLGVLVYTS